MIGLLSKSTQRHLVSEIFGIISDKIGEVYAKKLFRNISQDGDKLNAFWLSSSLSEGIGFEIWVTIRFHGNESPSCFLFPPGKPYTKATVQSFTLIQWNNDETSTHVLSLERGANGDWEDM